MNKTGVWVMTLSAVGFLVAIVLFYGYIDKQPGNQKQYLGKMEVDVFNAYILGEKELLYIDIAAKYSYSDSLGDLDDFKRNFKARLIRFNGVFNRDLSIDDYIFTLEDGGIKGITEKELNLTTENIDYRFKPNFRTSF